jgi:dephospho-CoA kinase
VKRILITGLSGSGKSTVIAELARLGHKAVDTDWNAEWEEPPAVAVGDGAGWVWREDRISELLDLADAEALFIGACVENQGRFYARFDQVVLLTVAPELTAHRLAMRTTNAYGRDPEELAAVLRLKHTVEPLLRRGATVEIDTSAPLERVVASILSLLEAN